MAEEPLAAIVIKYHSGGGHWTVVHLAKDDILSMYEALGQLGKKIVHARVYRNKQLLMTIHKSSFFFE